MFYRSEMPDRFLEWPHKTTCQLIPKSLPREGWLSHSRHGIPSSQAVSPTCAGSITCSASTAEFLVWWSLSCLPAGARKYSLSSLHPKGFKGWPQQDLSSLELSGLRRKFSKRGKCWGIEVGELVCECQFLAGFVVPLGWLQLSGEEGSGHWRWGLDSRRRTTVYLPTRLESSQCTAASDSFMLKRPWENNPEFSGVETWSHRDFLVFILHCFPE